MGYDDDRYVDEDGEPIMDPDMQSDREEFPEPEEEEDWGQQRSPSPVADSGDDDAPKGKQRRRLIKKSVREDSDEDEDDGGQSLKRKSKEGADSGKKKKKKPRLDDDGGRDKRSGSKSGSSKMRNRQGKPGSRGESSHSRADPEMKEMWDSIAGVDSEEDQEGNRTREDDAFIDDTGVDPHNRYASDDDTGSIGDAPQAEEGEEDDEVERLFKSGKKKNKKSERTAEETAMLIEQFMAKLEVAAEEDAELNRNQEPAINKLKMLPILTKVLSKKQLQEEFLDRGVLTVLKNWLEPLPDGNLPNGNVRSALLNILSDLPINVGLHERKEQLKRSGLGKVVMFLSKTDEETPANRKLARELVDKWSRPIFQKSTDYGEMRRGGDEEPTPYRRPPPAKKSYSRPMGLESRDDDLDFVEDTNNQEPKPGDPGYRQHAFRPEPMAMDFLVRPESKIDPEEVKARHKQLKQDERRQKMNKKLQQLKAPKKKRLQATKISVEGRGMVKYL